MNILEYIKKSPIYTPWKNIVLYRGVENPKIIFVGDAPDKDENLSGIPFYNNRSGKMLDSWIQEYKLKIFTGIIYSIPIIPLDIFGLARKPSIQEIDYFRTYTNFMIENLHPKIIVCLGDIACRTILRTNIGSARFNLVKNGKYFYTAAYHPQYYLHHGNNGLEDFKNTYIEISAVLEELPKIKVEPTEQQDIENIMKK
jgi:DNA polymerase